MNNKYKKLVGNSLIFAIGNFGSKVMTFIMVPIYSYTLTTGDYGKVDLITSLVQLFLPIICLDIFDSVFRFALDKAEDKTQIFSIGLVVSAYSSILIIIVGIILSMFVKGYPVTMSIIYILSTLFFSLISNFSRAINYVKQFAIAGIINSVIMGLSNIVFLVFLKLGMNGYMLSMALGQIIAAVYLLTSARLFRFIERNKFSIGKFKEMMAYGIPLIPNNLAWWLNSSSDRFFIIAFLGAGQNGIYAMASKIPSAISTINTIFFQSWQMSVVEEYNKKDGKKFISSVFSSFLSALFFLGIGLLAIIRPLYKVILSSSYFIGWKLTPALVLAVIYTSIASFLGTIFTASKKTASIMVTTVLGAIANVILTLILIRIIGSNGAAMANALSFLLVSILRYLEIKKADKIAIDWKKCLTLHVLFGISWASLFIFKNDIVVFLIGLALLVLELILDRELISVLKNFSFSVINRTKK